MQATRRLRVLGPPNGNGVAYNSVKGSCFVGSVQQKDGLCYGRSDSPFPNPTWDAGIPNGAVSMVDVLAVLAQAGLSSAGPP
jgi:hypothetical protein